MLCKAATRREERAETRVPRGEWADEGYDRVPYENAWSRVECDKGEITDQVGARM